MYWQYYFSVSALNPRQSVGAWNAHASMCSVMKWPMLWGITSKQQKWGTLEPGTG